MKVNLPIILLLTILSCKNNSKEGISGSGNTFSRNIPDTLNDERALRDLNSFHYTRKLTEKLSLQSLENGSDSFELRLWNIGSMWDPIVMYILKNCDNNWTGFHYQIFRGDNWNSSGPFVDSLIVNSVKPANIDWKTFISTLDVDSLWNTPFQWEVVPPNFGAVDGYSIVIELSNTKRYKYLHYYVPDFLKDKESNNKRVFLLPEKFRKALTYKEMRNL